MMQVEVLKPSVLLTQNIKEGISQMSFLSDESGNRESIEKLSNAVTESSNYYVHAVIGSEFDDAFSLDQVKKSESDAFFTELYHLVSQLLLDLNVFIRTATICDTKVDAQSEYSDIFDATSSFIKEQVNSLCSIIGPVVNAVLKRIDGGLKVEGATKQKWQDLASINSQLSSQEEQHGQRGPAVV